MAFSIRLSEEEKRLADSYAKIHSLSLGEAFKRALFERIEDEYDIALADEAYCRTLERVRSMNYSVETTTRFDKEFKKLDSYTKRMIKAWIEKNLIGCTDPRQHGKGLTANRSGQWRYRIGDYRLICQIEDDRLVILALNIGHRSEVYKSL